MKDDIGDKFSGHAKKTAKETSPKEELEKAIDRLPGLRNSLNLHKIDLDELDEVHIFGYGSLPGKPHYPPTEMKTAYLAGYKRDFCCQSVRSGTEEFNGLTLGLVKDPDTAVKGSVMTYRGLKTAELADMMNEFARREVPSTQIYTFRIKKLVDEQGKESLAIACVADTKAPGFVGDSLGKKVRSLLSDEERQEASVWRKASIIAQAAGYLPSSERHTTNKSYMDRFVRYNLEHEPTMVDEDASEEQQDLQRKVLNGEDKMWELIEAVDNIRNMMPDQNKAWLEKIEKSQWDDFTQAQEARKKLEAEKAAKKKPQTPPAKSAYHRPGPFKTG